MLYPTATELSPTALYFIEIIVYEYLVQDAENDQYKQNDQFPNLCMPEPC